MSQGAPPVCPSETRRLVCAAARVECDELLSGYDPHPERDDAIFVEISATRWLDMTETHSDAAKKYRRVSSDLAAHYAHRADIWIIYYEGCLRMAGDDLTSWRKIKHRITELEYELKKLRRSRATTIMVPEMTYRFFKAPDGQMWSDEVETGRRKEIRHTTVYGKKSQGYARHLKRLVEREADAVWWLLTQPPEDWMRAWGYRIE
jgi:hypothetical protein